MSRAPAGGLVLWLGLAFACGSDDSAPKAADGSVDATKKSETPERPEAAKADGEDPGKSGPVDDAKSLAPETNEPPPSLTRAGDALAVETSVDKHPGFRLEPLLKLHALDGTPAGTEYGAPVADATLLRDDDLDTAATCTPADDRPCAIGLSLPEPAKVAMLRVYVAAGPKYMTYKGASRPKTVRVHTDAGHTDVVLPDKTDYQWIIFAEPVATRSVSLEVADTYAGRKDPRIHFAELEVYGPEGKARAPLSLDPSHAYVYFENEPWKAKGGGQSTVRMTWLGSFENAPLGEASVRKRWIRAAALYGDAGDRFKLVEKVLSSTCDAPDVSYILVDTQSRMLFPLAKLAGGGATIHRHMSGMGFAAVPRPGADGSVDPKQIRAVVFDTASGELVRSRGKSTGTVAEQLAGLGFADAPQDRLGKPVSEWVEHPDSHCKPLSGAQLDGALERSDVFDAALPGRWWTCNVGDGHHMLLGRDADCGEKVSIMLAPPEGETVVLHEASDGGPRRVAVHDNPAFPGALVEVGNNSGAGADLVPVNIDYFQQEVVSGAALAVRPPAECTACGLDYGAAPPTKATPSTPTDPLPGL